MRTIVLIVLSMCLIIGGCYREANMTTPYDLSADEFSINPGTATIHGQAFLKTLGGDVKLCAGNFVILFPDTPYNNEFVKLALIYQRIANRDPRSIAFFRHTQCNAQGDFTFNNVPAGKWIIETSISWLAGGAVTGGPIIEHITIEDGQKEDIVLTM